MTQQNARRNNTQIVVNKNCHSREMLSGIFNAGYNQIRKKALLNECVEDPQLRILGMISNLMGFTLIELLVVVLIIGILTAVAVPQYQKTVLKSRYSAMMPIGKAVADGNEVYYLENGTYAHLLADLPIQGQANYPDGTNVSLPQNNETLSYVLVTNDNVNNARYVVYQKHSENFADTTMCEAGDNRAEELCVALGGQTLPERISGNSQGDDFVAYLLSGTYGENDSFATESDDNDDDDETTDATTPTVTKMTAEQAQAIADEKCRNPRYGCVGIANEDGTVTVCETENASVIAGKCQYSKTGTTSSGVTDTTYDADGNKLKMFMCGFARDTVCSAGYDYTYNNSIGKVTIQENSCLNGEAISKETTSCLGGYNWGAVLTIDTITSQDTSLFTCVAKTISPTTGKCAEYSSMEEYNYDTGSKRTRTCTKVSKENPLTCEIWGGWS